MDEINLDNLDEIFQGANDVDREIDKKTVDFKTNIDYDDALEALKNNIFNANELLEKIQDEMNNGNFSARLAEVAGTVINSVTQASKELIAKMNYDDYMEVRRALVQLKDRELDIKEAKVSTPKNQTNVLVTSREDLLKVLENKKPKQLKQITDEGENCNGQTE